MKQKHMKKWKPLVNEMICNENFTEQVVRCRKVFVVGQLKWKILSKWMMKNSFDRYIYILFYFFFT